MYDHGSFSVRRVLMTSEVVNKAFETPAKEVTIQNTEYKLMVSISKKPVYNFIKRYTG
jgi:hypothetical protein